MDTTDYSVKVQVVSAILNISPHVCQMAIKKHDPKEITLTIPFENVDQDF